MSRRWKYDRPVSAQEISELLVNLKDTIEVVYQFAREIADPARRDGDIAENFARRVSSRLETLAQNVDDLLGGEDGEEPAPKLTRSTL